MQSKRLYAFFSESFRSGADIYWTLLRITLPLLVVIRLLDEHFDLIQHCSELLAPLMAIVGLPGDAAIVFTTALFLQVYSGILLLVTLWTQLELSTAQVTILMTMMLVAHALPVEVRIVQKAGMSPLYAAALRLISAFALGVILNAIYGDTYLQDAAELPFISPAEAADDWGSWALYQLRNWASIFVIIQVLMLFVNLLRVTHAEKLIVWLMAPLLRLMGIGDKAITMTMVGMLIGLSYGGGLLIAESRKGNISRRDVFCALSLLCLCHAIVEDTLLAIVIGAHVSGALFGRVIFSLLYMLMLNWALRRYGRFFNMA